MKGQERLIKMKISLLLIIGLTIVCSSYSQSTFAYKTVAYSKDNEGHVLSEETFMFSLKDSMCTHHFYRESGLIKNGFQFYKIVRYNKEAGYLTLTVESKNKFQYTYHFKIEYSNRSIMHVKEGGEDKGYYLGSMYRATAYAD